MEIFDMFNSATASQIGIMAFGYGIGSFWLIWNIIAYIKGDFKKKK